MTELRRGAVVDVIGPAPGASVTTMAGDAVGAAARTAWRSRAVLAPTGREFVVVMAVAMIAGSARPLDVHGLLSVTIAAAIWLVSLRTAAAGAPLALGPRVPAAVGTLTGLVCVTAVNPSVAGLQLPLTTLLAMALGVFLSTAVWDSVLECITPHRVLVIGSGAVQDIVAAASRDRRRTFEVTAAAVRPASEAALPAPGTLRDLATVVQAQRPDSIVLTDEEYCTDAVERLLDMTDRRFRVAGLTSFFEHAFGCVPLPHMTPMVRPGMTGWAQVRCGYASDCVSSAEKLSYDFWYMRHNSLAVDLAVCVRTLMLMLEIFDPRELWVRRRAATDDALR